MVGNSSGSKMESNIYKKVYTSLYAWLFNKKVVIQANYDYDRTQLNPYHTSKTMMKGFVAYVSDPITVGVEYYMQTLQNYSSFNDQSTGKADTTDASSMGVSIFVRGRIIKDKLNFFARYDMWNPDTKFNSSYVYNFGGYKTGANVTENFATLGVDWMPQKNIHIMPNVWYDQYNDRRITTATVGSGTTPNTLTSNPSFKGLQKSDYDLVVRLTFWYIFK
jgi:hypothetical protein